MDATTRVTGGGQASDNLLKGSDLPQKVNKTKVVCLDVRESPKGFKSPFIMEIEPTYGKTDWALNTTNTRALISMIDSDTDKWVGYEIELSKFLTNNPSTKSQAWGLMVTGAEKLKRKPRHNPTEKQVQVRE
jgi:hypothetical protein